jgi:hypothetical protein
MAAAAIAASHARDVMGDKNPLADVKALNIGAHGSDFTGDLVAQNERRFLDPVPFHQVRAANAARVNTNQKLARADHRDGHLFDSHIPVVVVHGDTHRIVIRERCS